MSYHGVQFIGIAIVLASLAVGDSHLYLNASTLSGVFTYIPNLVVAVIGVIVTVIGAAVDPEIDRRLQRQPVESRLKQTR
jgi:mannose/fructose/N-acetylgalactosamine-specific phosphotransferase system component IIC